VTEGGGATDSEQQQQRQGRGVLMGLQRPLRESVVALHQQLLKRSQVVTIYQRPALLWGGIVTCCGAATHLCFRRRNGAYAGRDTNSTVQYNTVQYSTVQYSTVPYSTVRYGTVQYSTVQ
jgi:hypothetical protein